MHSNVSECLMNVLTALEHKFYRMPSPIQKTFSYTFQLWVMFRCSLNFTRSQGNRRWFLSYPLHIFFCLVLVSWLWHWTQETWQWICNVLGPWDAPHCKSIGLHPEEPSCDPSAGVRCGRKYIPEVCSQLLIQSQHRTNTCQIFRRTTLSLKLVSRSDNIGVLYLTGLGLHR